MIAVGQVYNSYEKEKRITERMFKLADEEYQSINSKLTAEKAIVDQSLLELFKALELFNSDPSSIPAQQDLLKVAEFVRDQAMHQKETERKLIESQEEAIRANNAKSDFLSVLTHEIRTPLNVIVSIIHVLLEDEHLEDQKENFDILKINTENLKYLINDILDFSKIESGKIELQDGVIDVKKLLHDIKKANSHAANDKNLGLKVFLDDDIPERIKGDPMRLGQCISNLVTNSIKYSEKGQVEIFCELLDKQSQRARLKFTIKDTGLGIPDEQQAMILEPFHQVRNKLNDGYTNHGTGLGLAIIQNLLNLMGSEVNFESTLGVGSTFYFELEADIVAVNQSNLQQANKNFNQSRLKPGTKILVVEDFAFNVVVIKKVLSKYDVNITVAQNGLEAVEAFKNDPNGFDIVLMDLRMPVMNGTTATQEIRKINTHTPIIALTASTTVDTVTSLAKYGLNDFISKPIDPILFVDKLGDILAASQNQ